MAKEKRKRTVPNVRKMLKGIRYETCWVISTFAWVSDWSDRLMATDLQWSETIKLFPRCINIRYWCVLKMRLYRLEN